jgi:hypothetical protein
MRLRSLRTALGIGFVTSLTLATGVQSSGEGGRVELTPLDRLLDTRLDDARVTSIELGSGVMQVWSIRPTEPGTAVIYPCDEEAPVDEYTFLLDPANPIQYSRFATGDTVCLKSTTPIDVIVDSLGSVADTPTADRDQFVALPQRKELAVTRTESGGVVTIPRPDELSDGATAAVLAIEVLSSDAAGYLTAYDCERERSLLADVAHYRNRAANVAYVALGPTSDICVFAYSPADIRVTLLGELSPDGPNPAALPPSWRYVPTEVPPPSLHPILAERVLDTRDAVGRAGTTKAEVGEVVEIGFGDLVDIDTSSVVLNVAVVQPDGPGHIRIWPCGGQPPLVASLNYVESQAVANLVVGKLSPSGTLCLQAFGSATHLVADLNGTYEADGGLQVEPVVPTRIHDTRMAIGTDTTTKVPAGQVVEVDVVGSGVVPEGAGAVTANFAVTQSTTGGYLTVFPCDEDQPTAANLNFGQGEAAANLVTAKLSPEGTVCVFSSAESHLIVDVAAWYGTNNTAGVAEIDPARFLDTREAVGVPTTTKVPGGTFIELQIGGVGDVPDDIAGVVMNITAVQTEGRGFVTAWACGSSMPTVSNLNYGAGLTRPNLATVPVSASGKVCLYTFATTHLVADVSGFLTSDDVEVVDLVLDD